MPARCPKCELTLHTAIADFPQRCPRCSSPLEPVVKLSAVQDLMREFADRDRLTRKPTRAD